VGMRIFAASAIIGLLGASGANAQTSTEHDHVLGASGANAQIGTPHDQIPDFCATPSIASVASGSWNSPSTWSPARVPSTNDAVRISAGTVVALD
jgi:hypothetical protein